MKADCCARSPGFFKGLSNVEFWMSNLSTCPASVSRTIFAKVNDCALYIIGLARCMKVCGQLRLFWRGLF